MGTGGYVISEKWLEIIAPSTPYIASFTENQLAHHSYDWDNGVIYQDGEGTLYTATPERYGIMQYECSDVCADYKDNTEEHVYSRDCLGTYVYAPVVGISYNANTEDAVTGMSVDENQIVYGGNAADQKTLPEREHYHFTGWYYDEQCTEPFDYTDALNANWTEVYAGWEKKATYTITVNYIDSNSGETISETYLSDGEEGSLYDVGTYDAIDIDTYRYIRTEGAALSGTSKEDVVINVYYARIETPVTPDEPEPPVTTKVPDTGDHMNVAAYGITGMLAISVAGALMILRRRHS